MGKNKQTTIMGVDIGSTKVCVAVAYVSYNGEIDLQGVGTSVTAGIEKGQITDEDALVEAVNRAIGRATQDLDEKPRDAVVNILPYKMHFLQNVGLLLSQEESGQISESDRFEALKRSKNVVRTPDQKMVHAFPISYQVDGVKVSNPVGVFGRSLEVTTQVVLANNELISSLIRVLKGCNLSIKGLVYDALSLSQVMVAPQDLQQGVAVCDIGGEFTTLSLFKDGVLVRSIVVPIGGETFTRDVAQCLHISIPEAERIKVLFGDVNIGSVDPEEVIDITTLEEGRKSVKKYLLSQILVARLQEMVNLLKSDGILNGFEGPLVLSGGGRLLSGVNDYMSDILGVDVRMDVTEALSGVLDNLSYASSVGLISYALKTGAVDYQSGQRYRWFQWIQRWFQTLF